MKFAFITTNLAGGGAEKAILKLATALQARNHEVTVWLLEDVRRHEVPVGITVRVLMTKVGKGWLGKRLAARRLRQDFAKEDGYDMIVSTLPFADEVAILADLPRHWCRIANTLSVEITALAKRNRGKAERRERRYRKLYGRRPLIAVSKGVAEDLRNLGCSAQIECIPNPFDVAFITAAAAENPTLLPSQPYVIHVGRYAPQKRHDLLLEAWARVKTGHLLVLLTDPDPGLDALIQRWGLEGQVFVAGFHKNPYPWIAGADLLVLCSDHEGLPNVLIEALLCGTPAVSTDCPSGPAEILVEFPDCLVPCGDVDALAKAIQSALAVSPLVENADLSSYAVNKVTASYEALARSMQEENK